MEVEVKVPTVGESITEVTIGTWSKKTGDYVEMDEQLCEIESDKATFELNAEVAGILNIKANEGDTVEVGAVIATIDRDAKAPAKEEKKAEQPVKTEAKAAEKAPVAQQESSYAQNHPSPSAKKILEEKGISPADVQGSGKGGRISKEDAVKALSNGKASKGDASQKVTPTPQPVQSTPGERKIRREKMTSLRKTIARRLVEVKNQTAMLTTFNEVDMSGIMNIRSKYKDHFKEKHGVGLGFMSFFTKAVCEALKEFPAINASIEETEIVYHDYADIGIAVSTPRGLVVPIMRNAESMSLAGIERSIGELAGRARDGKLALEEMQGGTFTITNGGVFGSLLSTPILNAPQSAILGMHNIVERPIAVNGQVVIRPMMYVALSYDHRIVDGRESVSFLVRVKQYLEDPTMLLMKGLLGL